MKEASLQMALATLSFMMAVIWGGPLIRILRNLKIGKLIRVEGPESHITKMGTPTMGGVMIILPVALLSILMNAASLIGLDFEFLGESVLLPLIVMLVYGLLGAIDDWEGIRGPRRGLGMRARTKFLIQGIIAFGIAMVLRRIIGVPEMYWPGVGEPFKLGPWYIPIAIFIIVGSSNAVNFTDGLDGLAGLVSATAFIIYGGIALMQGQILLGRFCFTVVGALFGFLWFNVHPAELFMGDTGSLSMGATLGVIALLTGQWLLLPLVAIIPVSETVSVILQIVFFKITKGRRLFKMAPLHHHFEMLGWSETQVVQRFWLVSLMFGMLALAVAVV
jgi:phospho-N-acetylmuramoyl-pentapeptide-transferase